MKRFQLFMFVAVVALSACTEAPLEDTQNPQKPHSGITLQLSLSESSIVQTRVTQSTAEITLNNLWLFVFNSSGTLVQKSKASVIRNDTHTADITLKEGTGLNLYACANVSTAEETKFDALVNGTANMVDLKAITGGSSLLNAPGLPMWGELLSQTITAATTKINMTLTRSCSRVDVVASGVTDFTLTGIEKLLKTAGSGLIFPAGSLVAASSTTDVVPTNTALGSIYLYENAIVAADETAAESKATAVIVKGTYKGFEGYYKLRVKYSSPVKYDIGRNVIYSINITSVKAPGFATLAEAEASYPQNVDYSVTASDGDAMDLVTSNGQYYLGVTNSEYTVYNSDALSDVAVVTVTHNAPSSITAGTVTATGTGLTVRTTTIPTSTQKQEIRVDMTAGFTTGTLTLRLGNLMKIVTINKRPTTPMSGASYTDYWATSYVQGDLDEATPTWFLFSKDGNVSETTQRVQNPNGGLLMRIYSNYGPTNQSRTSGAYITSTDAKGRARIVVKQEAAIVQYLSGIPTAKITGAPTTFTINLKTDLPGWNIKAATEYGVSVEITLRSKTGTPVRGTPADCSVLVTVPSNSGPERYVFFYFVAAEDPRLEYRLGVVQQGIAPATISISPSAKGNVDYAGGDKVTTYVTSSQGWTAEIPMAGVKIDPTTGPAGTNIPVVITFPSNTTIAQRNISVTFSATNDGYTATATFLGTQLEVPKGSYIPRSELESIGWPLNRLPPIGLQLATRGYQILPGRTPADDDPQIQLKTSETFTNGVEVAKDYRMSILGRGKYNTDAMIAAGASEHPAAAYCRGMGPNWYLPNVEELRWIILRTPSGSCALSANQFYLSSTEINERQVWALCEYTNIVYTLLSKLDECSVRCVREI